MQKVCVAGFTNKPFLYLFLQDPDMKMFLKYKMENICFLKNYFEKVQDDYFIRSALVS